MGESFAAVLQLLQGQVHGLLLQGALPALVQRHHTASMTRPLLQQLLRQGLVPHMQAAAAQACSTMHRR